MRWKPVVVQSEGPDGLLVVGHPLVDAYLEFLRARARPNTTADGACVLAVVQALEGAIGPASKALGPGAVAGVIQAHLIGDDPLTGACSDA